MLPANQRKENYQPVLSTETGDGKSFIGKQLEEYWELYWTKCKTSYPGTKISRIRFQRVFTCWQSLDERFTKSKSTDADADILIVEYPPLIGVHHP